jgi:hypothetical protein
VIVLDPFSKAGVGISLALMDHQEEGFADMIPSLVPPEPLTHLWLLPMMGPDTALCWARQHGWAVTNEQRKQSYVNRAFNPLRGIKRTIRNNESSKGPAATNASAAEDELRTQVRPAAVTKEAQPNVKSSSVLKSAQKKNRWPKTELGIVVSVVAVAISAVSAYVSIKSYESQRLAAKAAMADQVVIIEPPMSPGQFDKLTQQNPTKNILLHLPTYVQNYGRLPVLGLVVEVTINGKVEQTSTIGTLLPCTQVEVGYLLSEAVSKAVSKIGSVSGWNMLITFQDVSGQAWEREASGPPWPISANYLVLGQGAGITTEPVKNCAAS